MSSIDPFLACLQSLAQELVVLGPEFLRETRLSHSHTPRCEKRRYDVTAILRRRQFIIGDLWMIDP